MFCNILLNELDLFTLQFFNKIFRIKLIIYFIKWNYWKQFLWKNWYKNIWFFIKFNIKNKILKQKVVKIKLLKKNCSHYIQNKELYNYIKTLGLSKFYYCRYTKNIVCGFLGYKTEFTVFLISISHYVELFLKIKLNIYNTKFSHVTKGICFLGYKIWKKYNLNYKWKKQSLRLKWRQNLLKFNFDIPLKKLFKYFMYCGFFMKSKKKFTNKYVGKQQNNWLFLSNDNEILSKYNIVLKNIAFYYSGSTQQEVLNKLYFSFKKSLLLTIANRNFKKHVIWTFIKYEKNIKINCNFKQKKFIWFFKPKIFKTKWYKSNLGNLNNILFLQNFSMKKSKNLNVIYSINEISCSILNCPNKAFEWYYIKHQKYKKKLFKNLNKYISKKIGVCKKHYLLIRSGKYDGPSLRKLKGYIFHDFN